MTKLNNITPDLVRNHTERIVNSEVFARSKRMQRFLEFIVEETLAGHADQLGEYSIGVTVFDRGEDFEPMVDPIVRNDARRLRFKLMEYYRQLPARIDDGVRIDIPKGGYVPVFSQLSQDCRPASEPDPVSSVKTRRLAVLPFEVLSGGRDGARTEVQERMMGRALCMSLTAGLTNLNGFEAVAHGYLPEFPGKETVSELRLSHVIQGSVLISGERCRVIVNLIHTPNGTQLWAREFDVDGSEMLAFQSEITGAVTREVKVRLGMPMPVPVPLPRPQAASLAWAA